MIVVNFKVPEKQEVAPRYVYSSSFSKGKTINAVNSMSEYSDKLGWNNSAVDNVFAKLYNQRDYRFSIGRALHTETIEPENNSTSSFIYTQVQTSRKFYHAEINLGKAITKSTGNIMGFNPGIFSQVTTEEAYSDNLINGKYWYYQIIFGGNYYSLVDVIDYLEGDKLVLKLPVLNETDDTELQLVEYKYNEGGTEIDFGNMRGLESLNSFNITRLADGRLSTIRINGIIAGVLGRVNTTNSFNYARYRSIPSTGYTRIIGHISYNMPLLHNTMLLVNVVKKTFGVTNLYLLNGLENSAITDNDKLFTGDCTWYTFAPGRTLLKKGHPDNTRGDMVYYANWGVDDNGLHHNSTNLTGCYIAIPNFGVIKIIIRAKGVTGGNNRLDFTIGANNVTQYITDEELEYTFLINANVAAGSLIIKAYDTCDISYFDAITLSSTMFEFYSKGYYGKAEQLYDANDGTFYDDNYLKNENMLFCVATSWGEWANSLIINIKGINTLTDDELGLINKTALNDEYYVFTYYNKVLVDVVATKTLDDFHTDYVYFLCSYFGSPENVGMSLELSGGYNGNITADDVKLNYSFIIPQGGYLVLSDHEDTSIYNAIISSLRSQTAFFSGNTYTANSFNRSDFYALFTGFGVITKESINFQHSIIFDLLYVIDDYYNGVFEYYLNKYNLGVLTIENKKSYEGIINVVNGVIQSDTVFSRRYPVSYVLIKNKLETDLEIILFPYVRRYDEDAIGNAVLGYMGTQPFVEFQGYEIIYDPLVSDEVKVNVFYRFMDFADNAVVNFILQS